MAEAAEAGPKRGSAPRAPEPDFWLELARMLGETVGRARATFAPSTPARPRRSTEALLRELGTLVGEHAPENYASLETEPRFWALVSHLHGRHREKRGRRARPRTPKAAEAREPASAEEREPPSVEGSDRAGTDDPGPPRSEATATATATEREPAAAEETAEPGEAEEPHAGAEESPSDEPAEGEPVEGEGDR